MDKKLNLVWIDLEMTGLDPANERIIEIATIVTDSRLNVLAQGPVIAIKQNKQLLNNMDEWNQRTHGDSGLVDRVLKSTISERTAELQTLDFLYDWTEKACSPLCGNSIGQDRRFLNKYMPELESFVHYRNIDVSTIKELAVRWHPELSRLFVKKNTHQALSDIKESIAELRFFRDQFFRLPNS